MKGHYSGEAGVDWHLSKGTAEFCGIPRECRGELTFVNVSDAKVKVRTLLTQEPSRSRKDQCALKPTQISLFARIPPHSESKSIAALHLASDTAPGQYRASVLCGNQNQPINVHVLEHRESLIEPGHLSLKGVAGEKVSCKVTISNLGNVDLELGDVGMVWLREFDWIGRTLVYTLRDITEQDSYEDFGNQLLQRFQKEMIPPARILFEPRAIHTIAAGHSLVRTLSLVLPLGLKKGRRYSGFIKINESRIWLEVFCTGGSKDKMK